MEEELKRLYEAILNMNDKVSEINSKNEQLETLVTAMSRYIMENKDGDITEQEMTILDPFNLNGYKNVSSANGSVFKVKSKAFCVNGRHAVDDGVAVLMCSKCNAIVCSQHDKGLSPPLCIGCIKGEIDDVDPLDIYILDSVSKGKSINGLRKNLKGSFKEFNESQAKLIKQGYLDKDILFRKIITQKGSLALSLGSKLYDLDLTENGS